MTRPSRLLASLLLAVTAFTAMAAGRPLAPRTLGPAPWYLTNPKSAYAGDRFLTVWIQDMGRLGRVLMGAFSDTAGAKISQSAFALDIGAVRDELSYHLLADGDSFLLLWRGMNGAMNVADVDVEGRVTNRRTFDLPEHLHATFAWNGTYFLGILRTHETRLVMFDREGRVVLGPVPVRNFTDASDIVVAGDRFVVLTSASNALLAQEVTAAGVGEQIFVDHSGGSALPGYRPVAVVGLPLANGDVLVVWGTSSVSIGQLKSAIVRTDGTRSAETLLASGNGEVRPLEVLRTAGGFMAVFASEGALHRVRMNAAGERVGQPEVVSSVFQQGGHGAAGPDKILVSLALLAARSQQIGTIAVPAEGAAGALAILSIEPSLQRQPVLGAGRGEVLATWTEATGETVTLRGTAVDADGNPGAPVNVATSTLASTEIAWNGVHHLVVHRIERRLLATRVTGNGTVVDAAPIVIAELPEIFFRMDAGVVWNGTRWIVAWSNGQELHATTLSAEGEILQTRVLDVRPTVEGELRVAVHPALAFDGRRLLLVWVEMGDCGLFPCIPGPTRVYAVRLTRNGALVDRVPFELADQAEEDPEPSLSVASSGSEFLVLIDQKAHVVDEVDGELRIIAARELFGWPARSDVTWDGTSYAVALRYAAASWYLGVLRLDRAGNDAAMRRATPTLTPSEEAPPSIAAPFAGNTLIGVQEGSVADGLSATVYRERDLAAMPAPPGAPRNVRVSQISPFGHEVAWDAPMEGEADAYVIEQFYLGQWRVAGIVAAGVRHFVANAVFGEPPTVRVRAFNAGGPSVPADHAAGTGRPKRRSAR